MTIHQTLTPDHGTICDLPLSRLKKSPRNARKTPHSAAAIEALAASIAVKGMLQAPVVEPEIDDEGRPTGSYLVTIGEGRRLAQLLRAKRKEIKKSELIRCVIDTTHDAHEISLDENVTRSAMHPADQFEAFQRLAEEQQFGPEEIAARFGVSAALVRQRLRLAAVSPRLLAAYRSEELTLDQLMAFAITDDHDRQERLWESLQEWERAPHVIRRRLTHDKAAANDRRALLVGAEAYTEAGGVLERDLFAEDGGGYFASVALLDELALAKLQGVADSLIADGWKWAEVSFDQAPTGGRPRIYAQLRDFTEEEQAVVDALSDERRTLDEKDQWEEADEARYQDIRRELEDLEIARLAYDPEDKARSGVFVSLGTDGSPRIQMGFVRPEDAFSEEDETTEEGDVPQEPAEARPSAPERPALSDRLVQELTAHRTAALRHKLAEEPEVAVFALLHAFILRTFPVRTLERSCLDIRPGGAELRGYAPSIDETVAGRALRERHEAWAARIAAAESVEVFVDGLDANEALALLAHCAALSVTEVQMTDRAWTGDSPAERLSRKVKLDMSAYWTPTAETYFSRVSKSRILEAVTEAVSPDAARRITGAKKADMAEAAADLVAGTGWLPEPLRTPGDAPESDQQEAA